MRWLEDDEIKVLSTIGGNVANVCEELLARRKCSPHFDPKETAYQFSKKVIDDALWNACISFQTPQRQILQDCFARALREYCMLKAKEIIK